MISLLGSLSFFMDVSFPFFLVSSLPCCVPTAPSSSSSWSLSSSDSVAGINCKWLSSSPQPSIFRSKLPSSARLKKVLPGRDASNIRSQSLELTKSGHASAATSCIFAGRDWSSNGIRCCATGQAWHSSLKFFSTSLQRTLFFVIKIWCRCSYISGCFSS